MDVVAEKQPDFNEEEEEEMTKQDQFGRLPDEIVVIIVNKLFQLKTLLRFSLVAKRYSSLASHTRSLLVEFPAVSSSTSPASASASATATGFVARMCGFLKDMVSKLTLTEPEPDTRTQMLSAITRRFQQIKHLRLHDNPNSPSGSGSGGVFSFWFAMFGSHLEASLHLVAASVKRSIPNPNGSNTTPPGPGLDAAAFEIWLEEFKTVLRSASEKHAIIRGLASECKMIKNALFSENYSGGGGGGGALLMMKHHIAELRASTHDHDHDHPAELRVVVYEAPTLDLPRTGCTLNGVLLFLALPGDQDVDYIMQVVSCSDYESSEESDGEETGNPDDSSIEEFDVFTEATELILDDHHNWEPMYDSLHPYQELMVTK